MQCPGFHIAPKRVETHDRQFSLGSKPKDIARSDCCVVDDDTRRLDPGFGSLGDYIVKRGCRHLCDRRDIVEKTDQSDAQRVFALFLSGGGRQ
jgi:hypothetical protein